MAYFLPNNRPYKLPIHLQLLNNKCFSYCSHIGSIMSFHSNIKNVLTSVHRYHLGRICILPTSLPHDSHTSFVASRQRRYSMTTQHSWAVCLALWAHTKPSKAKSLHELALCACCTLYPIYFSFANCSFSIFGPSTCSNLAIMWLLAIWVSEQDAASGIKQYKKRKRDVSDLLPLVFLILTGEWNIYRLSG